MMQQDERYPELDALRGIAVLLMVLYHLAFDLSFFYEWNISVTGDAWMTLVNVTATMFFLLIGICFVISWERRASMLRQAQHRLRPRDVILSPSKYVAGPAQHDVFFQAYPYYLRRGLIIVLGGMLITLITYLFSPQFYVKFGVLHFIGVSTLLLPFFVSFKQWNFLFGLALIVLPTLRTLPSLPPYLFPLGFPSPDFSSLDYFPLVPWFGVILMGMAIGTVLYSPERHRILRTLDAFPFPEWLLACGKRSLWIYFVHQPLLLALLGLLLGMPRT